MTSLARLLFPIKLSVYAQISDADKAAIYNYTARGKSSTVCLFFFSDLIFSDSFDPNISNKKNK